jgi:hypothetical protein
MVCNDMRDRIDEKEKEIGGFRKKMCNPLQYYQL